MTLIHNNEFSNVLDRADHSRPRFKPMFTTASEKKIIYWRQNEPGQTQNFGDYLSEIIAGNIISGQVLRASSYRIVGSCIANWLIEEDLKASGDPQQASIAFWCCGVRDEVSLNPELIKRCRFFGVRGPLSRDILGLPADTVLGDTGLLMPLVHNPRQSERTAGRTICIPHINDTKSERHLQKISLADEIVFPNLRASEDEFWRLIDDIASATFVLCGALHAAVICYAYRVPFAFWDNGHVDLPMKWRDFAASIGIPCVFARSIQEGRRAYESMIEPNLRQVALAPILSVAPFKIRSEIVQRAYAYDSIPIVFKGQKSHDAYFTAENLISSGEFMASNVELQLKETCRRNELLEDIAETNLKERDDLLRKLTEAELNQESLRVKLTDSQNLFNKLAHNQSESTVKLDELVTSIDFMRLGMETKIQLAEAEAERLRRWVAQSESEQSAMRDRLVRAEKDHQEAIGHLEESRRLEQTLKADLAELSSSLDSEKRLADLKHILLRESADAARFVRGRTASLDREPVPPFLDLAPGSTICEALLFDESFYHRQLSPLEHLPEKAPDHTVIKSAGLAHYLTSGWLQGLSPSPMFDSNWYFLRHKSVIPPGMNPLTHYVRYGAAEGLQPHPCFDRQYYLSRYPEAVRHQPDAYQHFVRQGLLEGLFPSAAVASVAGDGQTGLEVMSVLLEESLGNYPLSSMDADASWPPRSIDDYSLPQALRDYVLDTFSNEPIDTLTYLMSVIAKYEAAPDRFGASTPAMALSTRIQQQTINQLARQADTCPVASIIIPVYNNCLYTLTCIASIFEYRGEKSFEIIVGDDSSTDETYELIEALGGNVRIVRHMPNKGFLENCNACATVARGNLLVFLNNDTIVLPDWLDNLIQPLSQSDIGLSGSKLINSDGTLQEAGGILWQDGSAWNYGRGDDPRLPTYSYRKDVDYCSGASIAISVDLWRRLNGFDTDFKPAYCEDSDLAMRVRVAGLRTVLEPFSLIIHHEGRSHGRDVDEGLKAFQVANQKKLFSRWQKTFVSEHFPNAEDVFLARDRSRSKPHIVVIDHYVPQWDHDAGSRTMFHFIRAFLAADFHVTFWPDNLYRTPDYAKRLQQMGVEVIYGAQFVNGFANWYRQVADDLPYALLSRPHVAPNYINVFDRARTKVIYYGHDLHWKRLEAEYGVTGQPSVLEEMETLKAQEIALCRAADLALYPSADEIVVLQKEISQSLQAIQIPAWYFDKAELRRLNISLSEGVARDGRHILFVGGFQHAPNVDGILWFMEYVWPLITAHDPATRITIAGSNPPDAVQRYAWTSPYITVTGFISDFALDQLYTEASVAIVPLRFGGGVKGKVIEAFSKGIPVVSTRTGVQGICDGADIAFIAEEAEVFAEHILACLEGGEHIKQRVRAAADFLSENYSYEALVDRLQPYIPEIGGLAN